MAQEYHESVLQAALDYANQGLYVFPVKGASDPARAKEPAVGRWSEESTTDPEVIVAMFAGTAYGIGLDCGKSGVFVLDGDRLDQVPKDLDLAEGWSWHGDPSRRSWLFKQPSSNPIGCGTGAWEAGEVKGNGGYVVLPPSFHPVGGSYVWEDQTGSREADRKILSLLVPQSAKSTGGADFLTAGHQCAKMAATYARRVAALTSAANAGTGRYPAMVSAMYELASLGAEGHSGSADALRGLKAVYRAIAPNDRDIDSEWRRAIRGLDMSGKLHYECFGENCGKRVEDDFARDVALRLYSMRVSAEARRQLNLEGWEAPSGLTPIALQEIKEPPPRIDALMNAGGTVLLTAQNKTGKTTLLTRLAKALSDGSPFLNEFEVSRPGRVGLFDLEMTPGMLGQWLGEAKALGDIVVYCTRGRNQSAFSGLGSKEFAAWLKDQALDSLIIDPLAPFLASIGVDESDNPGVRKALMLLQDTTKEAGINELILSHHTGWSDTGRARGASAFEDMADMIWRLSRDNGIRTFSAFGRLGVIEPRELTLEGTSLVLQGAPPNPDEQKLLRVLQDAAGAWLSTTDVLRQAGTRNSSVLHLLAANGNILKREGRAVGAYQWAFTGEHTTDGMLRDFGVHL